MHEVPEDIMHSALTALIDVRHHPILIHCNAGKHRTGCVSGCLRRLQGWALTSIFQEYNHFAGDKGRLADQLFIELYRPVVRVTPQYVAQWFEPHCGVTVLLDPSHAAARTHGIIGHDASLGTRIPLITTTEPADMVKEDNLSVIERSVLTT